MRKRQFKAALAACEDLLVDHPANANLNAYAGLCHFRLENYACAKPFLERAVSLDPSHLDAGIKLAQTYDRLHMSHECAVTAKQFLKLKPSDHTLQGLLDFHEQNLSLDVEGWESHLYRPAHLRKLSNR